ncbi:TPA: D-ribose pyranase [Pasteurella multocida]|uniref:D-ribose pyranase n=2 Tax=Pasteurella multocida TaxID=747 RepID=RBSD_PASMU|nr:D-ribose pyranase [Pasteurella multocida]Q9CP97.1 RecName: Full=D-ribose pyranase [Pasteurella multocida subsp. multocida str. Pm70]AAK02240.1 RbsD [Pasteurella multocida subsp. multocida str. Pm70]AFF24388.1 D-ribose pyranase [Pasteurella multocida subsp. multocida str. HN06]AFI46298.1 RbsD [Pasteurella multocida subsp. multocida str. 3480]AKD39885.1 D-ribose pyranase [Pasteurella multocida OH1905]APB79672.1 D-ribose pyranase [Pasteurella multocida]
MKKTALLNAPLSQVIATLGHTDSLTICDAGLPIPKQIERVDLALSAGVPSFLQTFHAVVTEMFVERAIIAEEIKEKNPKILTALLNSLAQLEQQQGNQIEVQYVSHDMFKTYTHASKAIVRSGECSPYANIILYSGVPF